jgi:nicotinamidase-related amidase
MTNTALILVDIQNDYFENGNWPVAKMDAASANAARLLAHARKSGQMVVHVHHEIPSEDAPFFRPGTDGARIHSSVAPQQDEAVILKHHPNSFRESSLLALLQDNRIRNVTICGAMSQMCIDATARAAADFGFDVTVAEDACGAKKVSFGTMQVGAEQVHATIMGALDGTYARVIKTDAYLAGSG